jgi:hypothetical protein
MGQYGQNGYGNHVNNIYQPQLQQNQYMNQSNTAYMNQSTNPYMGVSQSGYINPNQAYINQTSAYGQFNPYAANLYPNPGNPYNNQYCNYKKP